MNAFRWTRSREMRAANEQRHPLINLYTEAETVAALRRPDARDARGNVTPISVALWLTEHGWPLGDSDDPQGPVVAAKWLIFLRQCHEQTYRERGGAS